MRLLKPKGDSSPQTVALTCESCDQAFVLEGDDLIASSDSAMISISGVKPNRLVQLRCPTCGDVRVWTDSEWIEFRRNGGDEDAKALLKETEDAGDNTIAQKCGVCGKEMQVPEYMRGRYTACSEECEAKAAEYVQNQKPVLSDSYLSLHSGHPEEGSNELHGYGYRRVSVKGLFGIPAVSGAISNDAEITFPRAAGGNWGEATYIGVFDAEYGGNLLLYGLLDKPVRIMDCDQPIFGVGAIKFGPVVPDPDEDDAESAEALERFDEERRQNDLCEEIRRDADANFRAEDESDG